VGSGGCDSAVVVAVVMVVVAAVISEMVVLLVVQEVTVAVTDMVGGWAVNVEKNIYTTEMIPTLGRTNRLAGCLRRPHWRCAWRLVRVAVYGERGPVSTHQVSDFILFLVTVLLVPKDVSVSDRVVVIGRNVSRRP